MIRRLIIATSMTLALIAGVAFGQAASVPAAKAVAKTAVAKVDTAKAAVKAATAKVDTAQAKAATAQAKAVTAQAKVDTAKAKVDTAKAKAATAQAKADTAKVKAGTANAKAAAAQAKVDTAKAKVDTAQVKAATANAKAAAAQAKADTAKVKAVTAQAKVDTAKVKASTAQAKADTANAKAVAAQAKVDTAKAKVVSAKAANEIKIGALFAVTGPAANLGAPEAKTAEMMVEQINAKGGVKGKKLVLLIKDTGGNPEKAISMTKQLIEEDKVFAIIGPSTSGETMKIKSICEDAKTLLVSCAAAEVIVNPVAKYVFKVPQKDSDAVRKIYQTMQKLKVSKIAILSSNTGFGGAGKAQLEALAPEFKMEVVANEVYDKEATDLTSVATKVKAANPQAIVNWSIEPAQAIIIKNIRQVGITVPIFQSHGFGNINYVKQAGEAAEGVIFPAGRLLVAEGLPANHAQKAVLAAYKKEYETKYKEDVSTFGGHAYDAILVLTKAIEIAGGDKDKARDALEAIKGLVGTAGVFNFSATDHNGLTIDAFEMLTVKAGKFIVYQ